MKLLSLNLLAAVALLTGCATVQQPDPLEPLNRRIFAFNEAVDDAVLRPVAQGYERVVPAPVRNSVTNFFANPRDLISAINLALQGRPSDAASDVLRFSTNTVFGLLGLFDVATPLGMARHGEDFGLTFGRWGFGPGAYVVWPLLGPHTVRESIGIPIELLAAPQTLSNDMALSAGLTALEITDTRARLLPATDLLDGIALDRYLFVRDAYLQRRASLISNGAPPDDAATESAVTPSSFQP
jgi:phospholipid-binding lipoprotein MlaA